MLEVQLDLKKEELTAPAIQADRLKFVFKEGKVYIVDNNMVKVFLHKVHEDEEVYLERLKALARSLYPPELHEFIEWQQL